MLQRDDDFFFVTNGKGLFYENDDNSKTTAELRKFINEKLTKRTRTRIFSHCSSGKQEDLCKR